MPKKTASNTPQKVMHASVCTYSSYSREYISCSAAKAVERSASLVSERTMHSQIDAYVGGDGGWASGEVDPDEDDYPSSGGSDGDDFGADDY